MSDNKILETQTTKEGSKKDRTILGYFIKTLNGMALGLFSTLIIGVIIGQVGTLTGFDALTDLANALKSSMGFGIGLGVAYSLGLGGLSLIIGAVAGGIAMSVINDPMTIYFTTIVSIEGLRLILRKKTPFDIILIPLIGSLIAFAVASLLGGPISYTMDAIGRFINTATTLQPFIMGIIIAVIMGMALTAPISSAAIAISIGLTGLAGGAAVVGTSIQMIGFAVLARKDNDIGTVISIAFGTSMLQFKNILKKPVIWGPTIIASAILGPLATVVFKMESTPIGSGMGTSGLIGQIGTLDAMGYEFNVFLSIGLLHFILPIVLIFLLDILFRQRGWITKDDLTI
jgi:uncharacterized membrane protein